MSHPTDPGPPVQGRNRLHFGTASHLGGLEILQSQPQ